MIAVELIQLGIVASIETGTAVLLSYLWTFSAL